MAAAPFVLAIMQARMSSTRLPGKVLRPVAGAPMIQRQIERVRRARRIDRLVVATSEERGDDLLVDVVGGLGVETHRGPLEDVLARFAGALERFGGDHVVRLTADCPLADPEVIDAVLALHLGEGSDYASNTPQRRSFPKGLDVEAMTAEALRRAAAEAADPYEREHVTAYIYRRPRRFRLAFLSQDADEGEARWTVDLPSDLEFVQAVYDALHAAKPDFGSEDVRRLLRGRSDLAALGGERRL